MRLRILLDADGRAGEVPGGVIEEVTGDDLAELYRPPRLPWLRVNMVSTLDGAANGESGRSGSINNVVDKTVFHALRAQCDAVLVGAGTARTEGYGEAVVPLVLVSHRGLVPEKLAAASPGKVLLATCSSAPGLGPARELLGAENVIVSGAEEVDLVGLKTALVDRGLRNLLGEGGPSLLRDLLAADVVDELALTWVPRLIGGTHPRIVNGDSVDLDLVPALLLEHDGTLLGRWFLR